MKYNPKLISIIIPCRNEEKYIKQCIDSVNAFEIPEGFEIEVMLLDGMSTDDTINIITQIQETNHRIKLIPNPGIFQSFAMNLALEVAKGGWLMRLDAHSRYPINYLKLCLETSLRTTADNVGGLFITMPGGDTYEANLVQALTTHRFGVGDAGFRVGAKEGPADTVPYGFFRRKLFDEIGKFDERLVRAQDYEFNRRIIANGGVIWRNPFIHVHYYNQPTLTAFYKKQLFKEAPYNTYLWYLAPHAFAIRHSITGFFSMGIILGLLLSPLNSFIAWAFLSIMSLYFLLAIFSAIQQAIRYKQPLHAFLLPICFFLFHFIHGIGVIWGGIKIITGTAPVQKVGEPWSNAGKSRTFQSR